MVNLSFSMFYGMYGPQFIKDISLVPEKLAKPITVAFTFTFKVYYTVNKERRNSIGYKHQHPANQDFSFINQ